MVSPITGELVKISEMENHMRVSLIDPRWKEQRDAMMAKIRETTKADDGEIGQNLLSLAKTRPDIFGQLFPLLPLHLSFFVWHQVPLRKKSAKLSKCLFVRK